MKLGDKVKFSAELTRQRGSGGDVCWKRRDFYPIAPAEGIYIGTRTLWNGSRYWESDEVGYIFEPREHFEAALVVYDDRRNPIHVPLDAIE